MTILVGHTETGMVSYNVAEAKAHLSEILERVEAGQEVLLTRRGKPVARLVPDRGTAGPRQLGWAKHEIKLLPGWDDPVTEQELFGE
jgi:prevent-host-death family protein